MAELSNKRIALVTGANKGIGYETARQLASQGLTVLLGARDAQRGKEAAAKLHGDGLDVQFLQLDVNDQTTHQTARRFIEDNFGKLDILVNNAGIALDLAQNPARWTRKHCGRRLTLISSARLRSRRRSCRSFANPMQDESSMFRVGWVR